MFVIPRFSAWSLKTKFALCSGGLMFAFAVAFTSWTLHAVEADVRSSVTDAQRALVRTTQTDLDEKIALRRQALIQVAGLLAPRVTASGAQGGAQLGAFFASQPELHKLFDAVSVVDAAGRVLHDGPHGSDGARIGASFGASPDFDKLRNGAPMVISTPFRALAGGDPFIAFAAPLRTPEGRVVGALIGALNLMRPNVLGNLGQVRIGQAGYFAVIERGDKPLFVMHGQRERIMTLAPGGGPIMARARAGLEGSVEGVNMQGVETLRTFIPLRSVPWVLLAVYPTSEAYAGLHARQREVVWVGAALFVVASVLAWLMSSGLLRPLTRLRTHMFSLASDPGQPMAPARFGSAELAALVTAYNAQAARQRDSEGRLAASERRMREITDNLPVLISHLDTDERYLFLNATFKTWLGIDPAVAIGRTMAELTSPAVYARRRDRIRRCLAGDRVAFEEESIAPGGIRTLHTEYIPDRGADGGIDGFYTLISDVTELKNAQRQLAQLVRSDTLTGLPNRYQFNESLPLALARGRRSGLALALMFLDIDHFKHINDTFGHATGDAVLKEFALRLQRSVRTTDMAARLGGDEFVVVLEGLHDDGEPRDVARKILDAVNDPFVVDGQVLAVTTSVGIAYQASAVTTAPEVLALADKALYQAKAAGRNDYRMVSA